MYIFEAELLYLPYMYSTIKTKILAQGFQCTKINIHNTLEAAQASITTLHYFVMILMDLKRKSRQH